MFIVRNFFKGSGVGQFKKILDKILLWNIIPESSKSNAWVKKGIQI